MGCLVLGEFAEDVGDVGAGAFELLAAQLAAPRAAEQDRGEVVDRAARAAAGGVAFPAACRVGSDRARRVLVFVPGRRAADQPAARYLDPGELLEVLAAG